MARLSLRRDMRRQPSLKPTRRHGVGDRWSAHMKHIPIKANDMVTGDQGSTPPMGATPPQYTVRRLMYWLAAGALCLGVMRWLPPGPALLMLQLASLSAMLVLLVKKQLIAVKICLIISCYPIVLNYEPQ